MHICNVIIVVVVFIYLFYSAQVRCNCLPALVPAAIAPLRAPDVEIIAHEFALDT